MRSLASSSPASPKCVAIFSFLMPGLVDEYANLKATSATACAGPGVANSYEANANDSSALVYLRWHEDQSVIGSQAKIVSDHHVTRNIPFYEWW